MLELLSPAEHAHHAHPPPVVGGWSASKKGMRAEDRATCTYGYIVVHVHLRIQVAILRFNAKAQSHRILHLATLSVNVRIVYLLISILKR